MKAAVNQSVEPVSDDAEALIIQSLAKLDALAFGIALGVLFGLIVFAATNFLVLKGGEEVGPNLSLLSHYFIGYEVTPFGSLSGLACGFLGGFVTGSVIAVLRNSIVAAYVFLLRLKSNMSAANDFIDNP